MNCSKSIPVIMTIRTSPYYLIAKIILSKNIIEQNFYISSNMPINMNIDTTSIRQEFLH